MMKEERIITSKRIKYLDIAKAIGIILVLIGHISRNEIISKVIYSFHMPFFLLYLAFYMRGGRI